MTYIDTEETTVLEEEIVNKRLPNVKLIKAELTVEDSLYIRFKYVIESVVAFLAIMIFLPLLLIVALLIKLESSGPVFFTQKRYGLNGESFQILKFRTMVEGAHEMQSKYDNLNEMNGGRLFKTDNDPRVTRLGKFLRRYSIDELPQLINILKGDMTLIGPRPISTPLEEYKPKHLRRFSVKPGLGAIWQAYYRGETDFDEWMEMDIKYIENISLGLDLKLFVAILVNVINGNGAR